MTLEQLKNWIAANAQVGEGIRIGSIDGNADRFIGIYPGTPSAVQRVCLGGPEQTTTGELAATLLVHWTQSVTQAMEKAQELWALFYARGSCVMDGAAVCMTDPGGGPVPAGRDDRGVFEFVINLKIIYKKE